jgi:L-rhamnose-H+ transport protein
MYNLALAFGHRIQEAALTAGASPSGAVNTLWLPVEIFAFLANFGYCSYLLTKNGTWSCYLSKGSVGHWILATMMGCLWMGSISLYGLGANSLGKMGAILGFPVNMSMTVLSANVAGLITREWSGAPRKAYVFALAGMVALIAAIGIIGLGGPVAQ